MQVELQGQVAVVVGPSGPLRDAIASALRRNGVDVSHGDAVTPADAGERRYAILVSISPTSLLGEPETETITIANDFGDQCHTLEAALSKNSGRVVAIGSVLGLVPARADPERGAADAALFSRIRTEAQRLAPRGIRVNGLALGQVENTTDFAGPDFLSHAPVGRAASLAEVADAVLFLVDPENSYMTGHILPVDGGFAAGFARDF